MPYGDEEEPIPGDAADPSTRPPDCTCEPTDKKACKLIIAECTAANDCPRGWTCEDNPTGSCWADANGNSGCEPADPPKYCAPPYASLATDGRGIAGEGANAGGSDSSDGSVKPPTGTGKGSNDDGGCSLSRTPGSRALAWALMILGGLGLVRRRR
jgi:MYXO-CTERM domain-containing protein